MYIYNKNLLLREEVIKRKLPENINQNDYKIFKKDLKIKINRVYYYRIYNFFFSVIIIFIQNLKKYY